MQKIKENRDEYLGVFNSNEEDRQKIERLKIDKVEADNNAFRQMISGFEKKLDSETEYRVKNQDDFRKYVDSKFATILETIKSDEKMSLEREKRMMNQVQEGLVTMNDIIKGTKEQNLISLTHQ